MIMSLRPVGVVGCAGAIFAWQSAVVMEMTDSRLIVLSR